MAFRMATMMQRWSWSWPALLLALALAAVPPALAADDRPQGQEGVSAPVRAKGHKQHLQAFKRWLNALSAEQRATARQTIDEARPQLRELRRQIREKKKELEELRFSSDTPPEALPRLGREVQLLRKALRERLRQLDLRLYEQLGTSPDMPHHGDYYLRHDSLMPEERP